MTFLLNNPIYRNLYLKKYTQLIYLCLILIPFITPDTYADSPYEKAAEFFQKRSRPMRHFVDFGAGTHLINSFYPFELTNFPLLFHLNYRREKWGDLRLPLMASLQYEPKWKERDHSRFYTLIGGRYPTSHDLTHFYIDLLMGISFSFTDSSNDSHIPIELQLWFTHILGPKNLRGRLYLQWGLKARYQSEFIGAAALRMGIDYHL